MDNLTNPVNFVNGKSHKVASDTDCKSTQISTYHEAMTRSGMLTRLCELGDQMSISFDRGKTWQPWTNSIESDIYHRMQETGLITDTHSRTGCEYDKKIMSDFKKIYRTAISLFDSLVDEYGIDALPPLTNTVDRIITQLAIGQSDHYLRDKCRKHANRLKHQHTVVSKPEPVLETETTVLPEAEVIAEVPEHEAIELPSQLEIEMPEPDEKTIVTEDKTPQKRQEPLLNPTKFELAQRKKFGLTAGRSGAGKSTYLRSIALNYANAGAVVVWFCANDQDKASMLADIETKGFSVPDTFCVVKVGDIRQWCIYEPYKRVLNAVSEQHDSIDLIVFDPLIRFAIASIAEYVLPTSRGILPSLNLNTNHDHVLGFTDFLNQVAEEYNCTIEGLLIPSKSYPDCLPHSQLLEAEAAVWRLFFSAKVSKLSVLEQWQRRALTEADPETRLMSRPKFRNEDNMRGSYLVHIDKGIIMTDKIAPHFEDQRTITANDVLAAFNKHAKNNSVSLSWLISRISQRKTEQHHAKAAVLDLLTSNPHFELRGTSKRQTIYLRKPTQHITKHKI